MARRISGPNKLPFNTKPCLGYMCLATVQIDEWPDLRQLQSIADKLTTVANLMNWKGKLPDCDPNPAPVDGEFESPTSEERAWARPIMDTGQKRNPWLHNGNLKVKPQILKIDLILPNA